MIAYRNKTQSLDLRPWITPAHLAAPTSILNETRLGLDICIVFTGDTMEPNSEEN
jgi:hypothetical protein